MTARGGKDYPGYEKKSDTQAMIFPTRRGPSRGIGRCEGIQEKVQQQETHQGDEGEKV